jgi:hypothetical protein
MIVATTLGEASGLELSVMQLQLYYLVFLALHLRVSSARSD